MQLTATEPEVLPVEAARGGDARAWDALFKRFQLPLFAYVRELVRDEQVALDIVQESFINAVRYITGLREDAKFGSWLFGIAHQKCVQVWRRRQPGEPLSEEEIPYYADEAEGPDEVLIRKEKEASFLALVEALPFAHRTVLLLHYLEEFSLEEIATVTGTNLGTVKSRLHYAKKALRKLVEEQA